MRNVGSACEPVSGSKNLYLLIVLFPDKSFHQNRIVSTIHCSDIWAYNYNLVLLT